MSYRGGRDGGQLREHTPLCHCTLCTVALLSWSLEKLHTASRRGSESTEKNRVGAQLPPLQKNNCDMRTAGMARRREEKRGFSQWLNISLLKSCCPPHILLHLSELHMSEGSSIPMSSRHNEILNPVYSMSSDPIPAFILEAFPLAPADCSHLGF